MKILYNSTAKAVLTLIVTFGIEFSLSAYGAPGGESIREEAITIESWMTNLEAWESNIDLSLSESLESELEMEAWMLEASNSVWNVENTVDNEIDLTVEPWMTDLDQW
jgi:hypothetical protein